MDNGVRALVALSRVCKGPVQLLATVPTKDFPKLSKRQKIWQHIELYHFQNKIPPKKDFLNNSIL